MTTNAFKPSARRRTFSRTAGGIAIVTTGWFAIIVALTFTAPPGTSVAIVGSQTRALAAVAKANGRVLSSSRYVTIARAEHNHFVADLYAAGALLVLDAEQTGGCAGLSSKRIEKL